MTREEAIKEIRMWGIEAPRQREVLETLIPELRESEDERIRNCLRCLTSLDQAQDVIEDMGFTRQDLLAYLEKQKEQKPAEWSEEDKRKLNRIYEILGYAADDRGFLTSKRIIGDKEAIELQDFLKSLRPSWKPSEEQMEAFENVIKCELSAGLHTRAKILQTLYNDLKKLM